MPYAKVIGSLMYAAIQTWPDISFMVQHLSQYMTSPMQEHWTTVKHVLRYLKGTHDKGIVYSWAENTPRLEIYSNANFANQTDAKSISGYACIIDGACIMWSSKKQGTIALSTTKMEYIALTHAAKQMMWICCLLGEIGLEQRDLTPIRCDNLSTITITHDVTYHVWTKHIKIYYHLFTKKWLQTKLRSFMSHQRTTLRILWQRPSLLTITLNYIKELLGITRDLTHWGGVLECTTHAYTQASCDSEVTWYAYIMKSMRVALKHWSGNSRYQE